MTNYYTGNIKSRTVTTSKYYDDDGKLASEDTTETVEYFEPTGFQYPAGGQWWQNPIVTNVTQSADTGEIDPLLRSV